MMTNTFFHKYELISTLIISLHKESWYFLHQYKLHNNINYNYLNNNRREFSYLFEWLCIH